MNGETSFYNLQDEFNDVYEEQNHQEDELVQGSFRSHRSFNAYNQQEILKTQESNFESQQKIFERDSVESEKSEKLVQDEQEMLGKSTQQVVLKRSIELPYVDDIEVDPVPEIVEMILPVVPGMKTRL